MAYPIRFNELTRTEIGALAPKATVVLPVGAIEQHGPHLPVSVDARVVESVAMAAAEEASNEVPILVCPVVTFGASEHHLIFPGAMSLSTETLVCVLKDLTDSLVTSGFRRIFLLNGHGGNEECVRLVARELALKHDVLAGAASYWTLAWNALIDEDAAELGRLPGHAGGFETSLMMALHPQLVREDLLPLPDNGARIPPPSDPAGAPLIHRHGSWRTIDGYSDDAHGATSEKGKRLLEAIVVNVAEELVTFHHRLG